MLGIQNLENFCLKTLAKNISMYSTVSYFQLTKIDFLYNSDWNMHILYHGIVVRPKCVWVDQPLQNNHFNLFFRLHTHHDNNNSPNKTNLSPSKNNKKKTTTTTTSQPWLSPGRNRRQRSKSLDTNSLSLNDSSNEDTDKSDAKKSEKECR